MAARPMDSAASFPSREFRLRTLLALVAGTEHEARDLAFEAAGEEGDDAALEQCPPERVAAAFAAAVRRAPAGGSLSAEQRLALALVGAAKLDPGDAADLAGMPAGDFRERLAAAQRALAEAPARRAVRLEDEPLAREALVEQSVECGLDVVVATGAHDLAVAAAVAFAPVIALVDIELDGAELAGDLAAMQIREAAPDCHVLFVTGYPKADRMAGLIDNAAALIKPFRPEEFSAAIRAALPER